MKRTELRRTASKRKTSRYTGPNAATQALVYEREGNCCAACGKYLGDGEWKSVQHRLARGQGGGNELSNLILLCGSATSAGCHRKCEDREAHLNAQGFWLWSWQDPRTEPVMIHGEQGGVTKWLTDDGQYADAPPEDVAA